jgi:hypothetical protein
MDKVQKPRDSECHGHSPEPFRIYPVCWVYCITDRELLAKYLAGQVTSTPSETFEYRTVDYTQRIVIPKDIHKARNLLASIIWLFYIDIAANILQRYNGWLF